MKKANELQISDVISFDQYNYTKQVRFEGEDVGTILIDKETKVSRFRSKTLTIDGLHRIAEWSNEKLAKRIEVKTIRKKPSPIYSLFLKITGESDERLLEFARLIYKNKQLEDLPF